MGHIPETRRIQTRCPYCGMQNINLLRIDTGRPQVVDCEPELGGCDRTYVTTVQLTIKTTEYKLVEVDDLIYRGPVAELG